MNCFSLGFDRLANGMFNIALLFMWSISSCFGHIGVQGSSIYVDNTLMDMHTICCDNMDQAKMVFEDFTTKTDVCWTTLTTEYTHRGDAYGALKSFLSNVSGGRSTESL